MIGGLVFFIVTSFAFKSGFNYASFDCGAIILATNPGAKSSTSLLHADKDKYMINQCQEEKYVIVQMCETILVNEIQLANYEFFSSMFQEFKVSVCDVYPCTNWKDIGSFQAQNHRNIQSFTIGNPLIWARYIRIDFLTHYGNEFVCPVSVLKVFGTTMMEDLHQHEPVKESGVIKSTQRTQFPYKHHFYFEIPETFNAKHSFYRDSLSEKFSEVMAMDPHIVVEDFGTSQTSETPPQQPGTQESIYKNIMKRLSLLEKNTTLAYMYLESQTLLIDNTLGKFSADIQWQVDNIQQAWNKTMTSLRTELKQIEMNMEALYRDLLIEKEYTGFTMTRLQHSMDQLNARYWMLIQGLGLLVLFFVMILKWQDRLRVNTHILPSPITLHKNHSEPLLMSKKKKKKKKTRKNSTASLQDIHSPIQAAREVHSDGDC